MQRESHRSGWFAAAVLSIVTMITNPKVGWLILVVSWFTVTAFISMFREEVLNNRSVRWYQFWISVAITSGVAVLLYYVA